MVTFATRVLVAVVAAALDTLALGLGIRRPDDMAMVEARRAEILEHLD
jgi:hypothetical protein